MVDALAGPGGVTALAALTLDEPLWLAGLAAVAWPLWLHLRNARPGPPIWFPSIRLIERAEQQANQRDRWTDRLLLAMRCALIALITLLFAQPVWIRGTPDEFPEPAADSPSPGTDAAVALMVLDRTASMQVADAGRSRFDRARQVAEDLIADLPATHRAVVVVAGLQPESLLPTPTTNRAALTRALDGLLPTAGHTPLVDAVRRGLDVLPDRNALAAVHLVTDRQRAATEGLDELALPGSAVVRVHPVGVATPNLALREPRIEPRSPVVGQVARLSVEIANHGPESVTTPVYLRGVAGATSARLTIPAGEHRSWTVPLRFASTGWRTVTLALPGDALPLDDRIDLPVHVHPPVNVALVAIEPRPMATDPAEPNAAFYLERAVAPNDAGRYQVQRLDLDQLGAAEAPPVTQPRILLLVGDGGLSAEASSAIVQRVRRGAGLVVLSPELRFSDAAAMPLERATARAHRPGVGLTRVADDQPPWRAFTGEALATLLDVKFRRTAEAVASDRAMVSAHWPEGAPALTTASVDRGRIAWLTASIAPGHSDLVRSPAFAPLIHELLAMVEPIHPISPIARPGDPLRIPVAEAIDPTAVTIEGPSSERLPFVARSGTDGTSLELEPAREVGLYAAKVADELVGGAIVLLDPKESDLTTGEIVPHTVDASGAESAGPAAAPESRDATAGSRRPPSLALWPYVAMAVVLLAASELLVASIGRRRPVSETTHAEPDLTPLRGHGEAA
jgi:hypothetical protein